jgi:Fe-S cluster biosynthesis and repair protein YggX
VSIGGNVETIQCTKCGEEAPRLEKAPFRTELGERIRERICQRCWKDWLQHQTLLINHYGLDPRDPKAREFLYAQVEQALLEGGDAEQVDTSQQGTIDW